jgi:hypothetical protein
MDADSYKIIKIALDVVLYIHVSVCDTIFIIFYKSTAVDVSKISHQIL